MTHCCKSAFMFSVVSIHSAFLAVLSPCLSFCLLLTLFMLWFSFCFACAALFASVFSQLQSRSHSQEEDEQLGEVQEEEEGGGERRKVAIMEERLQGGNKDLEGKVDRDKEHQEDLVEEEEDLHQRSISETNLR